MIPFKNRFHGHKSLGYVYKNGEAIRSHLLTVKFIANPHRSDSRIAVVISKKTLKSAVRRNQIRRRVYEVVRLILPKFKGIYDITFIISNSEIINLTHDELTDQISELIYQAGIVSK